MSQPFDQFPNDPSVPPELSNNVFISTIDKFYNWGRKRSMWPMMFGLACCAIEMICVAAGRYDLERFGAGLMRPSPRQADLMIVSGTVTKKMVPTIVRLYNQMPEPKYVLSMGACATSGGPFKEGYNVPILGPDLIDVRRAAEILELSKPQAEPVAEPAKA